MGFYPLRSKRQAVYPEASGCIPVKPTRSFSTSNRVGDFSIAFIEVALTSPRPPQPRAPKTSRQCCNCALLAMLVKGYFCMRGACKSINLPGACKIKPWDPDVSLCVSVAFV